MANFIRIKPHKDDIFINMDLVTDFWYDPRRNYTCVNFMGDQETSFYSGNYVQLMLAAVRQ